MSDKDFEEFGQFLTEVMIKTCGVAHVEETDEDLDFLCSILEPAFEPALASAYIIQEMGGDSVRLLLGTFLNGVVAYRSWLTAQGYDVRKLEGR